MRNLNDVNKVLKILDNAAFFKREIFISTKKKVAGDWVIETYEIEINDEHKITLNHHKKAQAIATIFDIGIMICVDVDRKPYYYFY